MSKITLQQKIKVPEYVVFTKLEDEMVILNVESGRYYGLDAIGAAIFEEMKKSNDLQNVYTSLMEKYDVTAETLENDLLDFAATLGEYGLLTVMEE